MNGTGPGSPRPATSTALAASADLAAPAARVDSAHAVRSRAVRRARTGPRLLAGLSAALIAGLLSSCGAGEPITPPPVPNPAAEAGEPGTLEEQDVNAWLDGMMPSVLRQSGIAGATIAVVHDGEVLATRGYGHADTGAEGGEPELVDPEQTLFRGASVAKVFTATAVMQLIEAGDLDLDTDVRDYLDFDLPLTYDEPVTLRHLLSHTAGFEDRYRGLFHASDAGVDLRTYLATDPPEQIYPPGSTPAYSNYGLGVAGYIVEHVSGTSFETYISEHITAPLQMASSTFAQPLPEHLHGRLATSYPDVSAGPAPQLGWNAAPAAALTTTAADMATFMLAQLQGLEDVQLLEPETLDQMHEAALGPDSLGALVEGPQMALGFWQEDRNGHRILGHGGDLPHFHSHLQIYPDEATGIFVSVNSAGGEAVDNLVLRESVLHGFADRYFPRTGAPETVGVDERTAREHAEIVAGSYESSRVFASTFLSLDRLGSRVQVSALDDGRLVAEPVGLPPVLLEEVSPWVWREVGGEQIMTARVVDGQVEALSHEAGTTLLPVDAVRAQASVVVFVASVIGLLATVLAWPAGALVRRYLGAPLQVFGTRGVRIGARAAMVATLVAVLGWAGVMATLSPAIPPAPLLRGLQILTLAGVLGAIPATWRVVQAVRERASWLRVAAIGVLPLALLGIGWFTVAFRFLAPSVSY